MKDITIIIPISNLNQNTDIVFIQNALKSIPSEMQTIVVGNEKDLDVFNSVDKEKEVITIVNQGEITLPNQINLAVEHVKTKYFSVLEHSDVFTEKWFKNVENYSKEIYENVICYLPLTEIVDFTTTDIIGYANEAFWASSFSDEIGFMDINSLQDYININTHGGVFDTELFKELGKLKSSMKILYWYEFLLRALYKGKKSFVIPKVGYIHTMINQPYSEDIKNKMDNKEFEWWLDLANKEYFFKQDRNKVYQENK
jgi:hypothetical protein